MSKFSELGHKLYTGDVSYEFVAKRRRWYLISAGLMLVSLIALFGIRPQFGIEFIGGAVFTAPTQVNDQTVDTMREALQNAPVANLEATVNTIGDNQVRVQTRTLNATTEVPQVRTLIAEELKVPADQVGYSLIGASWGGQITQQAIIALVVFLVLVTLVIAAYFRNWKMSIAALVALLHDLVLTIGVYALVGFTVTPATVIGILTILGYSLYDTVVVFDKVRENVRDLRSQTVRTYSEASNLAVNQVLVRSINTTVIGVLPVVALLFAGAVILGEGPLKDLALALFIGMVSGAYSSIFIATPLLAQMKEREPEWISHASRVMSRRAKTDKAAKNPVGAAAGTSSMARSVGSSANASADSPMAEDAAASSEVLDPEAATSPGTANVTISSSLPSVVNDPRPLSEGAAKRPQPQNKPRSQRRK